MVQENFIEDSHGYFLLFCPPPSQPQP